MKIRLHNNDSTDYVDYEGEIEEISKGWSEVLEK